MVIYLASPMASTKSQNDWSLSDSKLSRNEQISNALTALGFDVHLPQDNQQPTLDKTWELQQKVIRDCEFLVLVLSDTRGVYIEAGYAKALGKKVYALEVAETRKYSEWLNAVCDYIAIDINELVEYLKENELKD